MIMNFMLKSENLSLTFGEDREARTLRSARGALGEILVRILHKVRSHQSAHVVQLGCIQGLKHKIRYINERVVMHVSQQRAPRVAAPSSPSADREGL
jgi:hypothetical protein